MFSGGDYNDYGVFTSVFGLSGFQVLTFLGFKVFRFLGFVSICKMPLEFSIICLSVHL